MIGCNEKVPQDIDLTKFLPEENTTRYHYRTTIVNEPSYPDFVTKDMLTKSVIISRKDHCVNLELYVVFDKWEVEKMPPDMREDIKENQFKSEDEILCAYDKKLTNSGYTFYHTEGSWNIHIESTDAKGTVKDGILGECNFINFSTEMIFGKQREIIHTKCLHTGDDIETEIDQFIVEGLGVYKSVLKSNIILGDSKHHSVMTKLLEKHE